MTTSPLVVVTTTPVRLLNRETTGRVQLNIEPTILSDGINQLTCSIGELVAGRVS
ncbi:MAG: hypothetical protein CM15mP39_11870 [Synechococcus sp.]|nr:MAG: hypothetical protein CM15mP39_11870 [Synechococcus sp.]